MTIMNSMKKSYCRSITSNNKNATTTGVSNINSVWLATEESCDSDWGSACSDINEYVSQGVLKHIHDTVNVINKKSYIHEILFTPNRRILINKFSATSRRSILLKVANDKYNIKVALDLIKYFNNYGYLNSQGSYNFLEIILRHKRNVIVKKLSLKDVNNIRAGKYDYRKFILNVAISVRNRKLRRTINYRKGLISLKAMVAELGTYNPYSLLYVEDGLSYDTSSCDEAMDDGPSTSHQARAANRRYMENEEVLRNSTPYRPTVIPERDYNLLLKLKRLISKLVNSRRRAEYRDIEMEPLFTIGDEDDDVDMARARRVNAQPEMMEPQDIDQQQEAGPVVLSALETTESVETTQNLDNTFWVQNSTGDAIVNQQHASSMEILVHKFKWDSTSASNFKIFDFGLPIKAISENPNHPAAMLFNQYAYWNGDLKIRIHVNTTPFHIGKLIFSWYYAADFDANKTHRDNIASSIQLPNVCFNASDGNDVVLQIPYRNYRSMLCTRKDFATDSKPLYLGNLRCHVFNALRLVESTTVDGYVHISFINNQFTGISPRVAVQPEMLPTRSMIKVVEGALTTIDKIANMDKPPNPTVPTMYMPQLTDSFASGTNDINNVHMLRLDPLGQTPHPMGSSTTIQETMINDIIRRPGLLKLLNWETSSARGYNLLRLEVSPELKFSDYYSVNLQDDGKTFNAVILPPVSAISCINAYNRGSIKYTIEIICSRYHTGALLASFTPRAVNVDINTAIQSYNATLDIGNVRSYDFIVPYINERPYNPRFNRESSDVVLPQLAPIGEFNLYVLNELRCVNGTSLSVYVNIYMSAGDDFEVAIPVAPLYSVCYDYLEPIFKNACYLSGLAAETGFDTWRYFYIDINLVVFKQAVPADAIGQLTGAKLFTVYECKPINGAALNESPYSVSRYYKSGNGWARSVDFNFNPRYFAVIIVNNDKDTYRYITAFYDLPSARSYVRVHKSLATPDNPYPNSQTLAKWVAADTSVQNYYLALSNSNQGSYRYVVKWNARNFPFYEVPDGIQAEMDNVIINPTTSSLPSAMQGLRLFGERFSDLKDYGRRYQIYGSAEVAVDGTQVGFRIRVPITPIGLNLNSRYNGNLHSITREGLIGYITSAYRFYRGSLRFKLIVTTLSEQTTSARNMFNTWYIQHKPDVMLSNRNIDVKTIQINDVIPSNVLQSGYAYTAFSPHVNNSITFEIPCYIPTNLLMLQKPNFDVLAETLHYTLGCFDIYGFTNRDVSKYSFVLHYSLGDDFDSSCFVGFPPMVPMYTLAKHIDNVDFELVQPEMGKNRKKEEIKITDDQPSCSKDIVTPELINEDQQEVDVQAEPEGLLSNIKDKTTGWFIHKTLSQTRHDFGLEPQKEDTVYQLVMDMAHKFGSEYKDLIVSIVSQILHCMMHPQVSTLVTAVVTILTHLGLRAYSHITKLTKLLTKYFQSVEGQMDDNKTETSSKESLERSFTSIIVDLGASLFGKPLSWVKGLKMPCFSKGLFNEIRLGALTISSCITLFKNLVEVVPKIVSWIGKAVNPVQWYRWLFCSKKDFIYNWVSDVEWFTDPNNLEKVKSNMKYAYHGELLVIVGRDISIKLNKLNRTDYDGKYINNLMIRLQHVHQILVGNFKSISGVGVEPYSFRLVGDSQVGKSFVSRELIYNALKSIGYKSFGNILYTRPKTRHFDGLTGVEAAIYYDDLLHIKTPEVAAEQIGEILTLKSKCLFVPPRAELADKGKAFNPLILAATMNETFPDFSSVCQDQYAWMNRFDDLIKVEFHAPPNRPNAVNCNDIPEAELASYDHVRFKIHTHRNNSSIHPNSINDFKSVTVPNVKNNATEAQIAAANMVDVKVLNFTQVKWYISRRFATQMEVITKECMKDLEMFNNFRPDIDQEFSVNIDRYLNFIKERNKYINNQEARTIELIKNMQDKKPCSTCHSLSTICPCNILNANAIGTLNIQAQADEPVIIVRTLREELVDLKKNHTYIDVDEAISFSQQCRSSATYMKYLNDFKEKPCIHKYINMMKSSYPIEIDFNPNNELCFIDSMYHEHLVMDDDCCKLLTKSPSYKIYVHSLFISQLREEKLPPYLCIEDCEFTVKLGTRYERVKKAKDDFLKFIDKKICIDTWLTRNSSLIYNVCSKIFSILCVAAGIFMIYNAKNIYNKVRGIKANYMDANKSYAKVLENHTVTEECVKGECYICIGPQMAYDEKKMLRRPRRVINAKTIAENEPQMASDVFNSLNASLKRNFFYIIAEDGIQQSIARCLGVRGQWFLAVDHYFDKFMSLGKNTQYYYCDQQQCKRLNFSDIKICKLKNSAIVICKLPLEFPMFKDIVKRFVSQDHMTSISPSAILYEPEIPETKEMVGSFDILLHRNTIKLVDDTLYIPDINGKEAQTTCEWYWQYRTSGKGLCGSVLITDMNTTSPLAGMHVAGAPAGGCGYAEVICRETLENAIEALSDKPKIVDIEIEGQMFNDDYIKLNTDPKFVKSAIDGDYVFLGTVPNRLAYRPPTKSKLVHTLCYNQITQSTYDYPHLSHKDERFEGSPMVKGCLHHTDPPIPFSADILNIVHDDIKSLVLAKVKPCRAKVGVLPIVDSICGIPTIPQYGAMELDTSEGFPFSSIRPKGAKDKRWLFDLEETMDGYSVNGVSSILLDVMANKQAQREQGIVPLTVFTDCLKDAKLPKEKCDKTRIFSISPVDFTIQFRQYFYDFTIAFQETRFEVESAVGINVDSYEWHDMVALLLKNSQKFVCGDYSKFGPRLMSSCVMRFFEIICDWYEENGDRNPMNRQIRMIMANEIAFACHLMLNMVYQVVCGAPSGCPITTILNNGVNMFYLRTAFITLARERGLEMYVTDYSKYVRTIFYGDDLIMTVKDDVIDWFNATTLSEFFSRYDIKFTDALKTGSVNLYTTVFAPETSFLKRNIKRHHRRAVFTAAMDKRAIEETCNWTFASNDIVASSLISCESMLLNAHGHGPEYYESLRWSVLKWWRQFGEYPSIPCWRDVDWRIYEGLKPFKCSEEIEQ